MHWNLSISYIHYTSYIIHLSSPYPPHQDVYLAFDWFFNFIGQVGLDVDFGHWLDFVHCAGGLFHGDIFVAVGTKKSYRVIAASVFHQQGFKEVVGYRQPVGAGVSVGVVGKDGTTYHMGGVILGGCQISIFYIWLLDGKVPFPLFLALWQSIMLLWFQWI